MIPVDISFIKPHLDNINAFLSLTRTLCNKSQTFVQNECVSTSTLKVFNETIKNLVANEKSLNSAVNWLLETSKNLTKESSELNIRIKIMEVVYMLENSIITLSFKLEDIANGLMFSKNNVLYPAICSPQQLYNDLVDNYRFLPSSRELPIHLNPSNIHILMDVSSLSTFYENNKIIFVVKIPLVNPLELSMYRVLPYPLSFKNESYITIIPTTNYIAFSRDRSQYCHFNDLSKCKSISQNYICKNVNILSSITYPICESEIVTKTPISMPDSCSIKTIKRDIEVWQELSGNKWIFVMSRAAKLSIDCPDKNIYEINICGTGIAEIPHGCIGYCNGIQIPSRKNVKIKISHITSDFDIIRYHSNLLNNSNSAVPLPRTHLKHTSLDSLITYKDNFETLNTKLNKIIEKPQVLISDDNHYNSLSLIVYTIVIVLSLALVYKLYKISNRCIPSRSNPSHNSNASPDPESPPISSNPRIRIHT